MGFDEIIRGNAAVGVEYWEKASAGGHLKAMHDLAELYRDGDCDVPMNKPRAIELFRKAADAGYPEAMGSLGICYATGDGVAQDDYEAFRWFQLAAEKGEQYAQKNLGVSYRNGRGTTENKALAAQWFEKAAEQGNIQAKACLADMYADGEGIPTNYSKAETYYREVIAAGEGDYYDDAIFNFALMNATKTKTITVHSHCGSLLLSVATPQQNITWVFAITMVGVHLRMIVRLYTGGTRLVLKAMRMHAITHKFLKKRCVEAPTIMEAAIKVLPLKSQVDVMLLLQCMVLMTALKYGH